MLDYSSQFVFQFCGAFWFWMLLSGLGDEFCDPLPALLGEWLVACGLSAFVAFLVFIY
jgi:hypothetical protein